MRSRWWLLCLVLMASSAAAQIQVELKLPRLQYIAYEPVVAELTITNLSGRDVDLQNRGGQAWFGFEVSDNEGQSIPEISSVASEPVNLGAGKRIARKVNLTPVYGVHDFGTYRVRAHIYFADLNKFFYSPTKVFEVTEARPLWQQTVGVPEMENVAGDARTYSLMTNRFSDHTSLYVRVEDRDKGIVYATYPLGRIISIDQPQTEFDRLNQLHILYCSAPRTWSYARIDLNGELVSRSNFVEAKTRPRLVHSNDGVIKVSGGIMDKPGTQATRENTANASTRAPNALRDE